MTEKDSTLHIAALQELEAALDAHRRTQAGASARPGDAPGGTSRSPRRVWMARKWGLRRLGWRLPFNPWFMFDRRQLFVGAALIVLIEIVTAAMRAVGH